MHNYVDHLVWDECAANLHILFWRSRKQWLLFFIFPRMPIIIYELPYILYPYHLYVPGPLLLSHTRSNKICTLTLSRRFPAASLPPTSPPPSTYPASTQYSHSHSRVQSSSRSPSAKCWFRLPSPLPSTLFL